MNTKSVTAILVLFWFAISTFAADKESNPVTIEIEAGAKYDSHLSVEELDKSSEQAGMAALLNAKLQGQWRPVSDIKIKGAYAYFSKAYQDNKAFDLQMSQSNLDLSYDMSLFTLGGSVYITDAMLADAAFLELTQSSVYLSKLINQRVYLRAAVNTQDKVFTGRAERDAQNTGVTGDLFVFFNQGQTFISLGMSDEQEDARSPQYDYLSQSVRARFSNKFFIDGKESKVQFGWRLQDKDYTSVMPEIATERSDRRKVMDLQWQMQLLSNLAMISILEMTESRSNLKVAYYSSNQFSIFLKANF